MTAAGVVSGILFLIPVIIISINLLGIVFLQNPDKVRGVTLRFLLLGLFAFLVAGVLGAFISLPAISAALHFTQVAEAQTQLWILGAISLPLFGLLHEALPQLLKRDCWCSTLSERHYWLTVTGFWLLIGALVMGGLITGLALSDATVSMVNISSYGYPFHVLEGVAQAFLLIAALTLGFNTTRALAWDYLFPKR
jgi:cbb3-type cytochrome oxidase subunit 1